MSTIANKSLRVAALRIRNILGVTEAEITPGQVTLIEGANGSGKTSILEALRAVLRGGNDATLLRKGSDHGEIILVLNDGQELVKEVTEGKTSVSIKHPEYGQLKKPRSVIDRLVDQFSLNPVEFLIADKKERLQLLLAAIPLHVNARDLAGVMDLCTVSPDFSGHALPVLDLISKDLYDCRTGVNRVAKEQRTTANEMVKALPPEAVGRAGEDPTVALRKLKEEQFTFLNGIEEKRVAIRDDAERERLKAREKAAEAIDELQTARDRKIDQIRQECERAVEQERAALTKKNEGIDGRKSVSLEMLASEISEKAGALSKAVAEAEAQSNAFIRTETTREHLKKLQARADAAEKKSKQLTEALNEVDMLRAALLEDLPIQGIEVRDGELFIDGIPFERVNESRRVRLAVDLAMLRAGALPLLAVDGVEALDSNSLAALEEYALKRDIQLVLARVSDGPLKVTVR